MSTEFQRSPCKSVRRASRELAIPKSTIHDVLHKRLRLHAYKIQLVQKLKPNDLPARYDFASDMPLKIDIENGYLQKVVFSDESTFHVCGIVNRHNCLIWGSENPHVVRELERDSPKINGYVFQQDGAPPHYALHVTDHLNECFHQRWIGRGGPTAWPLRSPDLIPLDFFFWGYIKDIVYKTVVADLEDLRRRIVAACATVTPEMLRNTWQEPEYRLDICRATRGDNASEMSPGSRVESYPAFARIGLRENPGKYLNQVTCLNQDLNSGPLVSRSSILTVTPQRALKNKETQGEQGNTRRTRENTRETQGKHKENKGNTRRTRKHKRTRETQGGQGTQRKHKERKHKRTRKHKEGKETQGEQGNTRRTRETQRRTRKHKTKENKADKRETQGGQRKHKEDKETQGEQETQGGNTRRETQGEQELFAPTQGKPIRTRETRGEEEKHKESKGNTRRRRETEGEQGKHKEDKGNTRRTRETQGGQGKHKEDKGNTRRTRETQGGQGKHKEDKGNTRRTRETQGGQGKQKEDKGNTRRTRETQGGQGKHKEGKGNSRRARETQGGQGKHKEDKGNTRRTRETQGGQGNIRITKRIQLEQEEDKKNKGSSTRRIRARVAFLCHCQSASSPTSTALRRRTLATLNSVKSTFILASICCNEEKKTLSRINILFNVLRVSTPLIDFKPVQGGCNSMKDDEKPETCKRASAGYRYHQEGTDGMNSDHIRIFPINHEVKQHTERSGLTTSDRCSYSSGSSTQNVINLVDKFRATECTERKKSVRWPTKVTEDAREDSRERMQRGPNKSVKKLAVEIGVSYRSAHKILRNKLVTNHNPRSEELTGARQIHVEAELPHLFRISRIPSVSLHNFEAQQDCGNCAMLGRGNRTELSELFV
ncbi:hypothetical protein ANN_16769 [Periplaneta americana]|uniref:Uncharacterized protein n=1 Tax=Periplaneta americana TaxID=6978 RepID=A0ABQ8SRU2_PERAM|nr:hypothetical protein ANN_16769 [Periplaneta americana]